MREFKEVPKVGTETVLVSMKCDICKTEGKRCCGTEAIFEHSRITHDWDTERVTVSIEERSEYPEGGSSETLFADICPECFRDKVMPFLKSLGVKFQEKSCDF